MKNRTSLIPAGGLKLISFDNTVEGIFNGLRIGGGSKRLPDSDMETAIDYVDENRRRAERTFSSLSVSIDGLLFDDGTFIGEDTFFYFDLMRGRLKARNDFLSVFTDSPLSDADRTTKLTNFVSEHKAGRSSRNPAAQDAEAAFKRGYELESNLLSREISRRRSRFDDQFIVADLLADKSPKKVVLRKLK
jgi:hypothetical protein